MGPSAGSQSGAALGTRVSCVQAQTQTKCKAGLSEHRDETCLRKNTKLSRDGAPWNTAAESCVAPGTQSSVARRGT